MHALADGSLGRTTTTIYWKAGYIQRPDVIVRPLWMTMAFESLRAPIDSRLNTKEMMLSKYTFLILGLEAEHRLQILNLDTIPPTAVLPGVPLDP